MGTQATNIFSEKSYSSVKDSPKEDNNQQWICSPLWDGFWFHSAIWVSLVLIILNENFHENIFIAGVFLFWIGHRLTSFYLAWGTRSYRSLNNSQKGRFVIFPILMSSSILLFLILPKSIILFDFSQRVLMLALLDFVWGLHHFAAQHYGFLRLYHHKSNAKISSSKKNQDRWFCWGVGAIMVLIAEILQGSSLLQDEKIVPVLTEMNWSERLPLLLNMGTLVVLMMTIWKLWEAGKERVGWPRIFYLLGLGAMGMAAFQLHPFQFLMIWTLQHWMAAVGLSVYMGSQDRSNEFVLITENMEKYKIFVYFKKWKILIWLCVLSVLLTPFFEIEAVSSGERYSDKILPQLMSFLEHSQWTPYLVALGFASGFAHYWMDRAVYRFSDAETRNSAQQLLLKKSQESGN